jgi:hypothetical protein
VGSVPPELVGGWRRTELVVGGEARDDADVLWLQGAEWYADVRIPHDDHGGPVEAFAGPAAWDPPHFTWHHRLDWLGSFPTDVGHLQWDRDSLIETGTFDVDGEVQPYSERWIRAAAVGPRLVAVAPDASVAVVRVGEAAIVITASPSGGFAVRRDRIDAGAAEPVFAREQGRSPLPPFPLDGSRVVGDRIAYDDDRELVVIDVG